MNASKHPSHGLGLNISKRIAIGLGGDLTFNDRARLSGSEFEFHIDALTKPQVVQSSFRFKRAKSNANFRQYKNRIETIME
jgi:hypothetical protein